MMPIPIKNPRYSDTYINVVVETEYYLSTYGNMSLFSAGSPYTALRSFSIEQIYNDYQADAVFDFREMNPSLGNQLKRIKLIANLMQTHWDDIVRRWTRNIPRSKLEEQQMRCT